MLMRFLPCPALQRVKITEVNYAGAGEASRPSQKVPFSTPEPSLGQLHVNLAGKPRTKPGIWGTHKAGILILEILFSAI